MIQIVYGNILKDKSQAIVIPVNTVGVMGKGLALQAARTWPDLLHAYQRALQVDLLGIGKVFTVHVTNVDVILFPTKADWRDPSHLEYIQAGLVSLAEELAERKPQGAAIPALGCGLGGLDWNVVRPLIEAALGHLPGVRLYEPQ